MIAGRQEGLPAHIEDLTARSRHDEKEIFHLQAAIEASMQHLLVGLKECVEVLLFLVQSFKLEQHAVSIQTACRYSCRLDIKHWHVKRQTPAGPWHVCVHAFHPQNEFSLCPMFSLSCRHQCSQWPKLGDRHAKPFLYRFILDISTWQLISTFMSVSVQQMRCH